VIEVACSAIIMFSYLGWVAAQITALGLVFNLLTQGAVSITMGMIIGTLVVLVYTLYGGMWSVAMTDFVQMIVIGVGLLAIAWYAADLAGGAARWSNLRRVRASSISSRPGASRNGHFSLPLPSP